MFIGKPKQILLSKDELKRFPVSIYFVLAEYLVFWTVIRLIDLFSKNKKVQCPLCGWEGRLFYPAVLNQKVITNRVCPCCASQTKDRSFIYALKKMNLVRPGIKILDVCPSRSNVDYFTANNQIEYTAIDLYPDYPGIKKMDVRDLKFSNGVFDYVFCLNVLEHIKEDDEALKELKRVVKVNGKVFVEIPMKGEQTVEYEKPNALDSDHVRQYGSDVTERFEKAGFKYKEIKWSQLYGKKDKEKYGLKDKTVFLLTK
ncbi:MAG: class I SAM-dependent methyltransferase [Patescibacteria group bacterium]|nr:class I SAM-dependent methyltransferase [Patescibacteria group bacterium]